MCYSSTSPDGRLGHRSSLDYQPEFEIEATILMMKIYNKIKNLMTLLSFRLIFILLLLNFLICKITFRKF